MGPLDGLPFKKLTCKLQTHENDETHLQCNYQR